LLPYSVLIITVHLMKRILALLFLFSVVSCTKSSKDQYALPNSYSNQSVGASANDILSAAKYASINIEVQYMPDYAPDPTVMNDVIAYLNTLCYKSSITYTATQVTANGKVLTQNDVMDIEKQNRATYTLASTLSLYVLITDNNFLTKNVLGMAYRNTSICLFGKTIYDNSGGLGQPNRIFMEENVLEHELGHLMGLVNLGSPMQTAHEDVAHASHCTNKNCLMYYQAETTDIVSTLLSSGSPQLDANCMADLHANGGR